MKPAIQPAARASEPLQSAHDGLLDVSGLAASWRNCAPHDVLSSWLDALLAKLELEFAWVRLKRPIDGVPREMLRIRACADALPAERLAQALDGWPAAPDGTVVVRIVADPMGSGELRVASSRLGIQEDRGLLVVGARRQSFPEPMEALLLQGTTNQALIRLDEVDRAAQRGRQRPDRERVLLSSLVENSTDFIGLASVRGQVWYVNAAGQQLVGLHGDAQVQGTLISDYIGPNDRWRLEHLIIPELQRSGRWEGEVTFRHFLSGAEVPMLIHSFFIMGQGSSEPIALACISRNITQRKREERQLVMLKDELAAELAGMKRLHELSTRLLAKGELSALLEEVLVATMGLQSADFGSVQLVNPASGRLDVVAQVGFSDELLGPIVASGEATPWRRAIAAGARVIVEDALADDGFEPYRAIAARAGLRAVQSTPLLDTDGKPLGVLSTHFKRPQRPTDRALRVSDMCARLAALSIERHRTQTALRRSEYHLAEAQRIGRVGSWVSNTTTGDLLWSAELCRILGLDPGARPSKEAFLNAVHADDRAFVREHFALAVARRDAFDEQFRLLLADGTLRHVHAFSVPVLDATKNVVEYVGTLVDITQRKLADDATRRAENELARVGRAVTMGELTASIAHELNQPLAAVAINANACMRWLAAEPANVREAGACARRIVDDAHRASAVLTRIRSLLTRSEPQKVSLRVEDVVSDVLSLVQGEARARGVTVQVQTEQALPSFLGDRVQLQQVLLNLTINGIEAMRSVGERARVLSVRAARHSAGELRFAVSDTGPGLAPEHRALVFDAFYTTKEQGMGMGLAICRSIVNAHGGRLWVEPNAGPGETFQFTLPTTNE